MKNGDFLQLCSTSKRYFGNMLIVIDYVGILYYFVLLILSNIVFIMLVYYLLLCTVYYSIIYLNDTTLVTHSVLNTW
jgi:hypothetical protein